MSMAVGVGLGAPVPATAQDRAPLIVVLDGSGSMWGAIEGTPESKIALVRDALTATVRRRAARLPVGLVTFGARSGGSCRSADAAVDAAAGNIDEVDGVLQSFNPQGRGPITLGLETARDSLPPGGGRLLLIHDGADNCGGDVCQFATAFHQSHPGVAIDVVSLALKADDRRAVACLAKATGGRWIEAETADDVTAGLETVVASLARPERGPRPATARARESRTGDAAVRGAAPEGANVALAAILKATGAQLPDGIKWRIRALSESGDDAFKRTFERADVQAVLAPGRYEITLETKLRRETRTIEVKAGEMAQLEVALDGAFLDIKAALAPATHDIEPAVVLERLKDRGNEAQAIVWSGPLSAATGFLIDAGRYRATLSDGLSRSVQVFALNAGEARTLALTPNTGRLQISARNLSAAQRANAIFEIAADDPRAAGGRRLIARTAAMDAAFKLAPGTYHVTLDVFGTRNTELVVLPGGQSVSANVGIGQMALTVTSYLGPSETPNTGEVRYRLWNARKLDAPPRVSHGGEAVFHLAPGKYRIESRLGHQNAVIVREFDIGRQRLGKLKLRLDAGRVSFVLPDGSAIADSNALWEVRDQNGRVIERTIEAAPAMTLMAGLYEVRVRSGQKNYTAKFATVAGHDQAVTLSED